MYDNVIGAAWGNHVHDNQEEDDGIPCHPCTLQSDTWWYHAPCLKSAMENIIFRTVQGHLMKEGVRYHVSSTNHAE